MKNVREAFEKWIKHNGKNDEWSSKCFYAGYQAAIVEIENGEIICYWVGDTPLYGLTQNTKVGAGDTAIQEDWTK